MLKKIYHLSDEGSRRLVKAGLCMCLYNLACLLPVILLAMVADEMLERYFGTVQGSIPLWGYWGTALILLLLIFLTYPHCWYALFKEQRRGRYFPLPLSSRKRG